MDDDPNKIGMLKFTFERNNELWQHFNLKIRYRPKNVLLIGKLDENGV
jgi:hypothetical protein